MGCTTYLLAFTAFFHRINVVFLFHFVLFSPCHFLVHPCIIELRVDWTNGKMAFIFQTMGSYTLLIGLGVAFSDERFCAFLWHRTHVLKDVNRENKLTTLLAMLHEG